MASLEAQRLIDRLGLEPLQKEGGFFKRLFLDDHHIATEGLGPFGVSSLPLSSVIYYLMTTESFSALHWLAGSEVWTWISGDPVEQVVIHPTSRVEIRKLGTDEGCQPVSIVTGTCWQGARLLAGGSCGYALCSTVMSPAYSHDDFKLADAALCSQYPQYREYLAQFLAKGDW